MTKKAVLNGLFSSVKKVAMDFLSHRHFCLLLID